MFRITDEPDGVRVQTSEEVALPGCSGTSKRMLWNGGKMLSQLLQLGLSAGPEERLLLGQR